MLVELSTIFSSKLLAQSATNDMSWASSIIDLQQKKESKQSKEKKYTTSYRHGNSM